MILLRNFLGGQLTRELIVLDKGTVGYRCSSSGSSARCHPRRLEMRDGKQSLSIDANLEIRARKNQFAEMIPKRGFLCK